jgi:hypothetical protein
MRVATGFSMEIRDTRLMTTWSDGSGECTVSVGFDLSRHVVSMVIVDAKANPFAATLPPTADGRAMG